MNADPTVVARDPSTDQERNQHVIDAVSDTKVTDIEFETSRISKKYTHYSQLLRALNNIDWTSPHNAAPINQLTPIAYWFMVSAQYFPSDCTLPTSLIRSLMESQVDMKKTYDFDSDVMLLEFRRRAQTLAQDPTDVHIDALIESFEQQLATQHCANGQQLKHLSMQPTKSLKLHEVPNTEGLLRDLCGLTSEELEYIDKREAFIQNQAAEELVPSKSFRKAQHRSTQDDPDGALCQVCNDGDYQDDNLIVFCSRCNICVHQRCYIVNEIPQGDWICDVCTHFGINGQYLRCPLCPKLGGAMKPTTLSVDMGLLQHNNPSYHSTTAFHHKEPLFDHEFNYNALDCMHRDISFFDENNAHLEPRPSKVWVHLACLLWIPECYIDERLETLKGVDTVDKKRFLLGCSICGQKRTGACIQCSRGSCQIAYHPECARRAGKLMSMHATSANKIEYLVFCDKHTPFKLKRVLETKYRLYEKEIVEFFKSYEKYRVHVNKQAKQKIEQKIIAKKLKKTTQTLQTLVFPRDTFTDEDVLQFSREFRRFLENQQITVNLALTAGQWSVRSVQLPILERKSEYTLRVVPEFLKVKPTAYQADILPFYRGHITETDPIWEVFRFERCPREQIYSLYQKCVRRAARFMAELTQGKVKRQAKLLELLTRRQNQIFKVEQKKEIVPTIINNEVYLQDDNLYCVCRKKFLEGQPMIQCEMCDEWFHFECLAVKSKITQLDSVLFYCFMCEQELEPKSRKKIKATYKKHFEDPSFYLQKQLAKQCNLYLQREENLRLKRQVPPPAPVRLDSPPQMDIEIEIQLVEAHEPDRPQEMVTTPQAIEAVTAPQAEPNSPIVTTEDFAIPVAPAIVQIDKSKVRQPTILDFFAKKH